MWKRHGQSETLASRSVSLFRGWDRFIQLWISLSLCVEYSQPCILTHAHSPGKEDTHAMWSHRKQSEQPGAVGGRFCSTKRVGVTPASHREMWLACLKCSVGWLGNGNPLLRDKQELCLVPLIRRVVWLEDLLCGSWVGRGTYLHLGHLRLSRFYQLSG